MNGKYVAEKIKLYKKQKQIRMIKALAASGFTCREIAFVFDLREAVVRHYAYGGIEQNVDNSK